MKIRIKFIFLICLLVFIFTSALIFLRSYEQNRLFVLLEDEQEERETVFDKILKLKETPVETLAYDYSYWDDMVKLVSTADEGWAHENIDPSLSTYKANAAWVYNTAFSLVYSVNNLEEPGLKELPLSPGAFGKLFIKENPRHFFVNTPKGLMEIYGYPIQPSADNKRETPAQGYFICGRLWDNNYINELSLLSDSEILISPASELQPSPAVKPSSTMITFSRVLTGWDNRPLAYLNVQETSKTIEGFKKTAAQTSILFIIFSVFALSVIYIFLMRWITTPLRMISLGLEKENTAYINGMQKQRNEFGDISQLIHRFFIQRTELIHDIAERKKAEEALRASEAEMRRVFENAGGAIFIADIETGRILECNLQAEALLGRSRGEITSMHQLELHPPGEADKYKKRFAEHVQKGSAADYEGEAQHKDGRRIPVWIKANIIKMRNKDVIMGLFIDISERKKAEDELRKAYEQLKSAQAQVVQASKMAALGQLSSGIAHEINNPLTGVLNNVQLIKLEAAVKKEFKFEDFKDLLNIIEESALRCKKITQSLLDLSHSTRGVFEPVSLNSLIEKALAVVSHEMELRNIVFQKDLYPGLSEIQGDPQLLGQVILNLLSNAKWAIEKKFAKASGGIITIKTQQEPEGKKITLSISDNGVGISEQNLAKLFEPFFTTKEVGEGTGLGLALSYNIIKNHKGEITVESQLDAGTTVKVNLLCP